MTLDQTHRGEVIPYILSDEEKEIVLKAFRLSRAYMVGVDHIIHKTNHTY